MTPPAVAAPDAAKRAAILAQAIRVFADEGFRNADVQVIADRAGVGKGTVYRYFGNKEDLFYATTFEITRRMEADLFAAVDRVEGPLEKLRAACWAYARFFEANPQYVELTVQERAEFRGVVPESHQQYHEELLDRFGKIVQEGIEQGEIRPVDVGKTIRALGSLLHGTVVQGCYHARELPVSEMTEAAVEILLRGIQAAAPTPEEDRTS